MKRGSLHTRSFRRVHFSVFTLRWTKNGFTGPKSSRGFRETGSWARKRPRTCKHPATGRREQWSPPPPTLANQTLVFQGPSWTTFSMATFIVTDHAALWPRVTYTQWKWPSAARFALSWVFPLSLCHVFSSTTSCLKVRLYANLS